MKLSVILLAIGSLFAFNALTQTHKISGVVTDKKSGATIPFADVFLLEAKQAVQTDFDGVYTFADLSNGTYSIVFRMEGYKTDTIPGIEVMNSSVSFSYAMSEPSGDTLEEFEIVFKVDKGGDVGLNKEMKEDASVKDGITAEGMAKTGDSKVNDVLKRVSGASVQDNRFVVIRGLSDRYNMAYINGAPLPSSESDRKAFAFDIFPSNMLDNLTITKTATPEMPGECTA